MSNFGDRNPADVLKEPMWQMFKTFGQKPNIPALKKAVYDLIKMSTQKTAGQRDNKRSDLSWEENLDMTLWTIVIEASALVLSGNLEAYECAGCEYHNAEDDICEAFDCAMDCDTKLPCEEAEDGR